jgi:TolB-like protein/DNA-binding winged helix-turn-helix (wHTH) protein/Tfp pilus assembly protein PilF
LFPLTYGAAPSDKIEEAQDLLLDFRSKSVPFGQCGKPMSDLPRRIFCFGPFRLDEEDRTVRKNGDNVSLSPKEFETLLILVEKGGHLVRKEDLIARVWPETFVSDGSLTRNISVLRRVLGEKLIETVPKTGYRLTEPVTVEIASVDKSLSDLRPAPSSSVASGVWAKRISLLIAAVILCVVTILLNRILQHSKASASSRGNPVRIAVLPLLNMTGNENQEYLCDGLTEAMISELGHLDSQKLSVIARTSVMQYRGTAKPIPQIGRELNVDYILEGSVHGSGDRLRITTQLVRASDASHLWTGVYDKDTKDILGLEQQIAVGIADEIELKFKPSFVQSESTVNSEAYRNYLLGRYYLNKRNREGVIRAREYFKKALEIEPDYARAYAGLADVHLQEAIGGITPHLDGYRESEAAAIKALQIDFSLAEAYSTLGLLNYMYRWDWAGADKNFQRAISLDPNLALAHARYGYYLGAIKRNDDSIREMQRAIDLDPLSINVSQNFGYMYALAGRYDEAITQLHKALDLDPNNPATHGYLGLAYEWKGDYSQALQEFRTAQKVSGRLVPYAAGVAQVLALAGRAEEARAILSDLFVARKQEPVAAASFAQVYAALGDRDNAFYWLQQAINERSCTVLELNDHSFDSLKSDQRFAKIRRQLKLEVMN